MDMSGKPLTDCRDFSTPFILVSAVFFGLYIFLAAGIFADMIPGTKMLFFPESGFMYIFNGTFFYAVLMIVSVCRECPSGQEDEETIPALAGWASPLFCDGYHWRPACHLHFL